MTTVTFTLDGPRNAKYRLVVGQMGNDVGGGVLWQLQQQRTTKAKGTHWADVASSREDTNDMGSRVLAGWLLTPMPLKTLGELVGHHRGAEVPK